MKSNKSYRKRLRVTKKGKIVARHPGQDHFNAKRSGRAKLRNRRVSSITMTAADRSRYLNG